jgi:hypothetical protein
MVNNLALLGLGIKQIKFMADGTCEFGIIASAGTSERIEWLASVGSLMLRWHWEQDLGRLVLAYVWREAPLKWRWDELRRNYQDLHPDAPPSWEAIAHRGLFKLTYSLTMVIDDLTSEWMPRDSVKPMHGSFADSSQFGAGIDHEDELRKFTARHTEETEDAQSLQHDVHELIDGMYVQELLTQFDAEMYALVAAAAKNVQDGIDVCVVRRDFYAQCKEVKEMVLESYTTKEKARQSTALKCKIEQIILGNYVKIVALVEEMVDRLVSPNDCEEVMARVKEALACLKQKLDMYLSFKEETTYIAEDVHEKVHEQDQISAGFRQVVEANPESPKMQRLLDVSA